MRYRDYKIFRPGFYYHIFNRGNNKQQIFFDATDYLAFLTRLKIVLGLSVPDWRIKIRPLESNSFSILSYCLMPNHFHFLIKQNKDIGINRLMAKLCTGYAMYFNKKHERIGNVFQDAFKAKVVENDTYAKYVSAYIHNNPKNLDYDYSSYKSVVGLQNDQIVDRGILLSWFDNDPSKYRKFVETFTEKDEERIKDGLFDI